MEYSEQSDKQNKSVVVNNEEVEDCAYMHSTVTNSLDIINFCKFNCLSRIINEITIN